MSQLRALSYKYPAINPNVKANSEIHKTWLPNNGTTLFRSDQQTYIDFNLAHNGLFVRSNQSWLEFVLTPRAANNSVVASTDTTNSYQGASRAFNRLEVLIGSTVIEDIPYDDFCALELATKTERSKAMLKKTEGFSDTKLFTGGARKFAMPIRSSLFMTDQALPLPLVQANGGITLRFWVASVENLFTSSVEDVPYFTVDFPKLQTVCVSPHNSFTAAMVAAVRSGRSAFLATQRVRVYYQNGNGSQQQIITVPVGGVSSVSSFKTVYWNRATYGTNPTTKVTADRFTRFINPNLKSWKVEAAGITQPESLVFEHGANDPSNAMLQLMTETGSVHNIGELYSLPADYETQHFSIGMSFESDNEVFGSGLATVGAASPNIQITTTHGSNVSTDTSIITYVLTAQLVEFTSSVINVSEIF